MATTKHAIMDNAEPHNIKHIHFSQTVSKEKGKMDKTKLNTMQTTYNHEVSEAEWLYKEPIPLIPKLRQTALPSSDCSHLIREIFQEELRDEMLPLQTAKNLLQTSKNDAYINEFANKVTSTYDHYDVMLEDILLTEKNILCGSENSPDNLQIEKFVEKYPLLKSEDLLPETYERVTDYQTLVKPDLKQQKQSYISRKKLCLNNDQLTANNTDHECNQMTKIDASNESISNIFIAKPNRVYFINCKPGVLNEQRVKLKNISSSAGRFNLVPLPNGSVFSVYFLPLPGHTKMVAPGMSAIIVIQYKAQMYEGHMNTNRLHINVLGGDTVKIKIISYREPPILIALPLRSPPTEEALSQKERMLIETIDCGNCFVGDQHTLKIELYNYGGKGRFWICNEEAWYFSLLRDLPTNNVLPLPPFLVSPFFFSVLSEEIIDLNVTFAPTEFGLQSEKLYFLCDNCVVRTTELIGDAIVYVKSFLTFSKMEKTFAIDIDDDEKCEHWLDLGEVGQNDTIFEEFTMANNSGLSLSYRWDKRKAVIQKISNYIFLDLPDNAYTIYPETGEIPSKSTVTFQVTFKTHCTDIGQYRHVLRLVVIDLPPAAITQESHVQIIANESVKLVDIITGEVEIWLKVVPLVVSLEPCIICITGDSLQIGKGYTPSSVYIRNYSNVKFKYIWEEEISDTDTVIINMFPRRGQVKQYSDEACVVSIQAVYPGQFQNTVRCIINGGEQVLNLVIQGEVAMPTVGASTESLDFGIVAHSSSATITFQVISTSQFPAIWHLEEFRYDFETQNLVPETKHNLTTGYGYLCHRGSKCDVIYNLNTCRPRLWCSLLVLSSFMPNCCIPNAYILVTANIMASQMTVMAPVDYTPILTIHQRLYVGLETSYTITLRNMTKAPTHFKWNKPTGLDSTKLNVRICPNRSIVAPAATLTLTVTIDPLEAGNITQFYVSCIVGYNPIPLILSIVCNVDCLTVTFHMPKRSVDKEYTEQDLLNVSPISWSMRGRDIMYPWLKKAKQSCTCGKLKDTTSNITLEKSISVTEEVEIEVTDLSICPIHSTQSVTDNEQVNTGAISAIDFYEVQQETFETHHDLGSNKSEEINFTENTNKETLSVAVPTLEQYIVPCIQIDHEVKERTKEFLLGVHRDVIQIENPTVLRVTEINDTPSSAEINLPSENSLEVVCTSENSLLKYLRSYAEMEFLNMPCYQLVSQTFVVRNETPLTATLCVSVSNYGEQESGSDGSDLDLFKHAEAWAQGVRVDSWKSRVRKDCGVVVVIAQCSHYVEAYGVVPVTVWVYADTWGQYREKITCQLTGLPPFQIEVMIRVVGSPITFPMDGNCVHPVSTLRFGNLRYRGKKVTRKLRVINTSSIDVCIVWKTLIMDENEKRVEEVTEVPCKKFEGMLLEASSSSFSLMPLVEDEKVSTAGVENGPEKLFRQRVCKIRSAHSVLRNIPLESYDGETSSTLFQVSNLELPIPAKGEAVLQITVDPTYSENRIGSECQEYNATLVGIVRIDPEEQYRAGRIYRHHAYKTDPVMVELEVALDVPQLEREDCQSDVHVTVSLPKLLHLPNHMCQTVSHVALFKNLHNTILTAEFVTEKPYSVVQVVTLGDVGVDKVTVWPGQRVEVHLECAVDKVFALETVKLMEQNRDDDATFQTSPYEKAMTFEYELQIKQDDLTTQAMTLYVSVLCPVTRVSSEKLLFGQVFLKTSKKMHFRVENKSDLPTRYSLVFLQACPAYTVTPTEGFIPPTKYPDIKGTVEIAVTFAPKDLGEYRGRLLLRTTMKSIRIQLQGFGTRNQSYKK